LVEDARKRKGKGRKKEEKQRQAQGLGDRRTCRKTIREPNEEQWSREGEQNPITCKEARMNGKMQERQK
jgi:hypothetical protein